MFTQSLQNKGFEGANLFENLRNSKATRTALARVMTKVRTQENDLELVANDIECGLRVFCHFRRLPTQLICTPTRSRNSVTWRTFIWVTCTARLSTP